MQSLFVFILRIHMLISACMLKTSHCRDPKIRLLLSFLQTVLFTMVIPAIICVTAVFVILLFQALYSVRFVLSSCSSQNAIESLLSITLINSRTRVSNTVLRKQPIS